MRIQALLVLAVMLANQVAFAAASPSEAQLLSRQYKEGWSRVVAKVDATSDPVQKRAILGAVFSMTIRQIEQVQSYSELGNDVQERLVLAKAEFESFSQELEQISDSELGQFAHWMQNQSEQALAPLMIVALIWGVPIVGGVLLALVALMLKA